MKMTVRNRKWIAALLALMMALCGVSALAENGEETAAQTEEAATQTEVVATQTEEAEPVLLATVNGEEIRSDNAAMQELISYYTEYYGMYGYDVEDPSLQVYLRYAGLQWAIEDALYRQKAQELGVAELTEEQKTALENEALKIWENNLAYFVEEQGITEEATEKEKAAARLAALAEIEATYGYTQESYVQGYVESYSEVQMRQNVSTSTYLLIKLRISQTPALSNSSTSRVCPMNLNIMALRWLLPAWSTTGSGRSS